MREKDARYSKDVVDRFPQPAPGEGAAPGPLKVPAGQLRQMLGVRTVSLVRGTQPLAVIDTPLA